MKLSLLFIISQKGTPFYPEEIRVGLTIQHPSICSVYGIIIRNGSVHILLEHAGILLVYHSLPGIGHYYDVNHYCVTYNYFFLPPFNYEMQWLYGE